MKNQNSRPTYVLINSVLISASVLITADLHSMNNLNFFCLQFCPKETGAITATTGECMCHWQHEDGCVGSGCQFQYGLSWYHHSCTDCHCVKAPPRKKRR
uniref:Uncharacterized protein n=1 Tax=Corethron hystrix TaxID=216773 RepID=A0A7S1BC11_9STRA